MLTFIDLFAGCGGFSAGLRRAGFEALAEVEIDAWAADTLRANFGAGRVIQADIRTIDEATIERFAGVDVIVGGPPCQGFSVAGSTQFGAADPRNELFYWFLHWVELLHPKIAVIENVPTILTKVQNGQTVQNVIRERLSGFGYQVEARILNAADFGTPQARRRAFIVAYKNGVPFAFPEPTHSASPQANLFQGGEPHPTVWQAISDLPQIESGQGTDNAVPYGTAPNNAYQRYAREGSDAVRNHVAMKHTARLIERFKVIAPGKALKDVPIEHGQIAKLTGEKVKKPFGYNNYRLDPDLPALTIPASFQSLFLHPYKHRNLTAREAARLMGFQDTFQFCGKRTTMSWEKHLSQYNQIGNAVCPPVGEALGRAIFDAISIGSVTQSPGHQPASMRPLRLQRPEHLPTVRATISSTVRAALSREACSWLDKEVETFSAGGFSVPAYLLAAAVILTQLKDCPICSPDAAPYADHDGQICFLISKDDLSSLRENGQDHGLDYHLRSIFGIDHQIGHLVGELLSEFGMADLIELNNQRTGRRVRGMRIKKDTFAPTALVEAFAEELRRITHVTGGCSASELSAA